MTNREAYKDKLDGMLAMILAVAKGKPVLCDDMSCRECDFKGRCMGRKDAVLNWLNAEYQEPSVDWSKVPIDTPVLASDDGEKWHKRYYAGMGDDGDPKVYSFGQTSWSGTDGTRISYEFMRLAEGNE
jgi:hypothetical protein